MKYALAAWACCVVGYVVLVGAICLAMYASHRSDYILDIFDTRAEQDREVGKLCGAAINGAGFVVLMATLYLARAFFVWIGDKWKRFRNPNPQKARDSASSQEG